MSSLLASPSFPPLSFLSLKDFMWVSLFVLFLMRQAVVYTFVTPKKKDSSANQCLINVL